MEHEYPVLITQEASAYSRMQGEDVVHYGWELSYPSASSAVFHIRITSSQHSNETLWYRNMSLAWVLGKEDHDIFAGAMGDDTGTFLISNALPHRNEIRQLVQDWLFGAEGVYMGFEDIEECEDCGEWVIFCEEEHITCEYCEELAPAEGVEGEVINRYSNNERAISICAACTDLGITLGDLNDTLNCEDCNEWYDSSQASERSVGRGTRVLCFGCVDEYRYCAGCESFDYYESFNYDEEDGESYCDDCYETHGSMGGLINEWNYRPQMVFFPPLPENPFRPVYIGIEFELNWHDYHSQAGPWIESLNDYGDLLYAKDDSSIDEGFEVCSMPMSPDWALENFPFEIFQEAIDEGADESHHSTGMHIHMDRTAFSTAQMWKFLQIHRKMSDLCGVAGGRGTDSDYARFDNAPHLDDDRLMRIARTKGQGFDNEARYTAVNLINDATIELRYMEGGINPDNIRKNIQWVKALYDFTDHINVEDVKNGVLSDYGYLLGWITDESKYPQLAKHVKAKTWMTAKMPDREMAVV